MNQKRFLGMIPVLLSLLLLAMPLFAGATENQDNDPIDPIVSFAPTEVPPTPTPDPTPVPTPEPTPDISSSSPDVTETPAVTDTPSEEPTTTPDGGESSSELEGNGTGIIIDTTRTTPIPTPTPNSAGRPISTPNPTVTRPRVDIHPGTDPVEEEPIVGTNYVTFARLNVRNNSLAFTLFYGGIGCVATGSAGLLALLVLFIRGRRYAEDERNEVLEQIEEAEQRSRQMRARSASQANYETQYRRSPAAPAPSVPREQRPLKPSPLLPVEADLYTEEFSLAPQRPAARQESSIPAVQHRPAETRGAIPSAANSANPTRPRQEKGHSAPPTQPQGSVARAQAAPPQIVQRPMTASGKPASASSRPAAPGKQAASAARPAAPAQKSGTAAKQPRPAGKPPAKRQTSGSEQRRLPKAEKEGQLSFDTDEILDEILHRKDRG